MSQMEQFKTALLQSAPWSEDAVAASAGDDFDEETRSMIDGYDRAMSTGSVSPLVQSFGMSRVANLLRGVSDSDRSMVARRLFTRDQNHVRAALRAIAMAHIAHPEGGSE